MRDLDCVNGTAKVGVEKVMNRRLDLKGYGFASVLCSLLKDLRHG